MLASLSPPKTPALVGGFFVFKMKEVFYKMISWLKNRRLLSLGVFLLLLLIVGVIYFPAIKSGFILDDYVWIEPLNLLQIKNLFIGSWEHGNALRPIMRLQFFSDRLIWGEWAVGWHLTTVFFHVLVSFCGYLILKKITKRNGLAFIGALIFAIFPTNHEVVAWVSGRTNSFGLLLSLAAWFLLYRQIYAKQINIFCLLGGYFLLLLAFLTYEVSFIVPIVLVLMLIFFGPRNRKNYLLVFGAVFLLVALLAYRYQALGGTFGSVGQQYSNIFLAPFLNFDMFKTLYWYSRELKIVLSSICLILFYLAITKKVWKNYSRDLLVAIFLFVVSGLAYAPFVITKGVAPRFLYSSLFFSFLGLVVLYHYLSQLGIKPVVNYFLFILVFGLGVFSLLRTVQVVDRYCAVGQAYQIIGSTLRHDFPVWPEGKDMLFYNIPDGNKNILAFLTYFEKSTKYNYGFFAPGRIYRADRLPAEQLKKVLETNPIVYQFVDFDIGARRVLP